MKQLNDIIRLSDKYEDYIIKLRRIIHENPELSFKEFDTSKLVLKELEKLSLEVTGGIAGTGIVAELKGGSPGKTVLLRAEMDALPISENTDLEFRSANDGIMHACGHDVHTASLIGVAKILSEIKEDIKGNIVFMFQPGEEKGGGCKKMLAEGILGNKNIDSAIALHIMPVKQGKILLSKKNITAYSDGFTIKIYGKSAHTSKPQDGIDAVYIAGNIIVALNSMISKFIDPRDAATLSIGSIKGGKANNIVADYVEMGGMIRSVSKEPREVVHKKLKEISAGISDTYGGRCKVEVREGYPSIYNDEDLTKKIRDSFSDNYQELARGIQDDVDEDTDKRVVNHKPMLTADDFGYLSERVPSVYYMLGTGNFAPGHSPEFYVDERYIKLCTRTMALAALELLSDYRK